MCIASFCGSKRELCERYNPSPTSLYQNSKANIMDAISCILSPSNDVSAIECMISLHLIDLEGQLPRKCLVLFCLC